MENGTLREVLLRNNEEEIKNYIETKGKKQKVISPIGWIDDVPDKTRILLYIEDGRF